MLDHLHSLLAIAAIYSAAFGLGRLVLRGLRLPATDGLSVAVRSIALGLILVGALFRVLAAWGLMCEPVVWITTALGALWACVELACSAAAAEFSRTGLEEKWRVPWGSKPPSHWLIFVVVIFVFAAGLVRSLVPPVDANQFASSLEVSKTILVTGGTQWLADDGVAPNLSHMWSLWALGLDGPVAVNLFYWALAGVLLLATVVLARSLVGVRSAVVTSLIVSLTPIVHQQMGMPSGGLAMALMAAVTVAGMYDITTGRQSSAGAFAVVGIAAGGTAAVHWAGGLFVVAIIASFACFLWTTHANRGGVPWLALAAGAAVTVAIFSGFTFLRSGRSDGGGEGVLTALGPVITVGLGGLFFSGRFGRLGWLLGGLTGYAGLAALMSIDASGWAALVPVGACATACAWQELYRFPSQLRWGVLGLLALASAADLGAIGKRTLPYWEVACGLQSREQFLAQQDGSYRAAAVLNLVNLEKAPLLTGADRGCYFSCPLRTAQIDAGSANSLQRDLAWIAEGHRVGAAYLLLSEPLDEGQASLLDSGDSTEVAASRLAASKILALNGEVEPILEYRFADDNNRCIRYRLWKLLGHRVGSGKHSLSEERISRLPGPPTR